MQNSECNMGEMEVEEFFIDSERYDVFTFGVSPIQIDIMTKCKGLSFDDAYEASRIVEIEGVDVRIVGKHDLILAKQASNRTRDRADIEELKKLKDELLKTFTFIHVHKIIVIKFMPWI